MGSLGKQSTPSMVMADLNEQSWKSVFSGWLLFGVHMLTAHRFALRAEKELQATLTEKEPTFRNIDFQLSQYVPGFFGLSLI